MEFIFTKHLLELLHDTFCSIYSRDVSLILFAYTHKAEKHTFLNQQYKKVPKHQLNDQQMWFKKHEKANYINPVCPKPPITALFSFFLTAQPQTAWQRPVSRSSILASQLMQTGMGFLQDLLPRFRYCLLFLAMSFVQSSVEFERCCVFRQLCHGHTIDARK